MGIKKHNPALGKVDFHSLRTTYISQVVEQGETIKEAMTLSRHSTPSLTLNTYARAWDDRLAAIVEGIGASVLRSASTTGAQRKAAGAESACLATPCVVTPTGVEPVLPG